MVALKSSPTQPTSTVTVQMSNTKERLNTQCIKHSLREKLRFITLNLLKSKFLLLNNLKLTLNQFALHPRKSIQYCCFFMHLVHLSTLTRQLFLRMLTNDSVHGCMLDSCCLDSRFEITSWYE